METTNININQSPAVTLAPVLQSAAFVPMDSIKGKGINAGNRWLKLIKKGENSKLAASVAVEVPEVTSLPDVSQHPAIASFLLAAYHQLENEAAKQVAIAGGLTLQYSSLSLANLEAVAVALNESSGIGQLSEERIKSWFDADAREMVLVALADKLGVSETATDADIKRLEQVANQVRDNLAKLASRKPVQFDERVKKALNMALDVSDTGDNMTTRLRDKLNIAVGSEDLLLNLGL